MQVKQRTARNKRHHATRGLLRYNYYQNRCALGQQGTRVILTLGPLLFMAQAHHRGKLRVQVPDTQASSPEVATSRGSPTPRTPAGGAAGPRSRRAKVSFNNGTNANAVTGSVAADGDPLQPHVPFEVKVPPSNPASLRIEVIPVDRLMAVRYTTLETIVSQAIAQPSVVVDSLPCTGWHSSQRVRGWWQGDDGRARGQVFQVWSSEQGARADVRQLHWTPGAHGGHTNAHSHAGKAQNALLSTSSN